MQATLSWMLLTNLVGATIALACAAIFSLRARLVWTPRLVSFAIGTLLGAAFLVVFPACLKRAHDVHTMISTIMLGIVFFFVLEKLLIWRHHHHRHGHEHQHSSPVHQGRSAHVVLIGNAVHHLLDGVMIAAAFLAQPGMGVIVAGAILIHATAQQMGDYCVLIDQGLSSRRAIALGAASIAVLVIGSALAFSVLSAAPALVPYVLALAAASLIYLAVADLIPGLQERLQLRDMLEQIALIGLGVSVTWLLGDALGATN